MARLGRAQPTRRPQYLGPSTTNALFRTVGRAVETDIALSRVFVAVGRAVETDTASTAGRISIVFVGQSIEADAGRPVTPQKTPVAAWSIRIDWDADGFMSDDEVTGDVLESTGLSMEYGRDQARSLSPMAAGRASLELNNRSEEYSPDNQDSPLYGKLLQARPLRIQATLDGDALNTNSRFGTDVSGWTPSNGSVTHSTAVVHPDGAGSLKFTPDGSGLQGGAGSNIFSVTPGEAYRATLWANAPGGWDDVHVLMNWYDDDTMFLFSEHGTDTALPAGEWVETGDRFIAPDSAGQVAVWMWLGGSPTAGDVIYGWDIRLGPAYGIDTLFRGHTDEFTLQPARDKRSVDVTALDPVSMLKGAKATTQLYSSIRTGTAIGHVLDAIDWPASKRDLDLGATLVPWWWVEDQDAFEAVEDLVRSEGPGAVIYADEFGRIVFRDRHHRLVDDASTRIQTTFWDDSSDNEPAFSEMTYDHGWRDVVNSVSIKVEELAEAPDTEEVWEDQSVLSLGLNETRTIRVTLDDPVTDPSLSFTTINGSVSGSITVDSGQTITISLDASVGGATVSNVRLFGRPVTSRRSFTVLVEDSSSIANYGKRSVDYEVPWADVNHAEAIGQLVLDANADRKPIVTVTLRSGTWVDGERLRQQLARRLSDRVHIYEPHTHVDHDFFIDQVSHQVREAGLLVETTFGTERATFHPDNVFRFDDADHGFGEGVFASVGMTDPDTIFRFDTEGQGFNEGVFVL